MRRPRRASDQATSSLGGERCFAAKLNVGVVELDTRVRNVVETLVRILRQAPSQQMPDSYRRFRRQPLPIGFGAYDCGEDVGDGLTPEYLPTGQSLVQHTPEGPDIGSLVYGLFHEPALGSCSLPSP